MLLLKRISFRFMYILIASSHKISTLRFNGPRPECENFFRPFRYVPHGTCNPYENCVPSLSDRRSAGTGRIPYVSQCFHSCLLKRTRAPRCDGIKPPTMPIFNLFSTPKNISEYTGDAKLLWTRVYINVSSDRKFCNGNVIPK